MTSMVDYGMVLDAKRHTGKQNSSNAGLTKFMYWLSTCSRSLPRSIISRGTGIISLILTTLNKHFLNRFYLKCRTSTEQGRARKDQRIGLKEVVLSARCKTLHNTWYSDYIFFIYQTFNTIIYIHSLNLLFQKPKVKTFLDIGPSNRI